jgi:hypothetical protein
MRRPASVSKVLGHERQAPSLHINALELDIENAISGVAWIRDVAERLQDTYTVEDIVDDCLVSAIAYIE